MEAVYLTIDLSNRVMHIRGVSIPVGEKVSECYGKTSYFICEREVTVMALTRVRIIRSLRNFQHLYLSRIYFIRQP
jgi:hypothetical protein